MIRYPPAITLPLPFHVYIWLLNYALLICDGPEFSTTFRGKVDLHSGKVCEGGVVSTRLERKLSA